MKLVKDTNTIEGWAVDADPENNPAYPMKHTNEADQMGINDWQRPPLQQADVEILQSIERPGLSAVFGTSTPPSGISGMIRRFAFRFSESSYAHWFPLVLADRINVVEGIFSDLLHGRIPNIFSEMGMKAEIRHNPRGFVKKVAIASAITYAAVALYRRRQRLR